MAVVFVLSFNWFVGSAATSCRPKPMNSEADLFAQSASCPRSCHQDQKAASRNNFQQIVHLYLAASLDFKSHFFLGIDSPSYTGLDNSWDEPQE